MFRLLRIVKIIGVIGVVWVFGGVGEVWAGEKVELVAGWNLISWPEEVFETRVVEVPRECPVVATENFGQKYYVKDFGGSEFVFDGGRKYYLQCNQAISWDVPFDFYGQKVNFLKLFGQKNWKETSEDTVVANKIFHASGVVVDKSSTPNRIYVADTGNNRILGFSDTNIYGTRKADLIFGQPDESSATCNGDNNLGIYKDPSAETLCLIGFPEVTNTGEYWMRTNFDVDSEGSLYVPDVHNNRILKFNQPFSLDKAGGKGDTIADFVWGQSDFNLNGINGGQGKDSRGRWSLFISFGGFGFDHVSSRGISVDNLGNLWVADTFNRRVLRFPPNSQTADLVLGQNSFAIADRDACWISDKNMFTNKLCTPTLARIDPGTGELFVIDERPSGFKARILVFKPPFTDGMYADRVMIPKQDGPLQNTSWQYYFQATGLMFNSYQEGDYASGQLWLSEHTTNRIVLIDKDSNIIKVIGAPDKYNRGCDYVYYDSCGKDIFSDFNLCGPGSSVGIDSDNNVYLADEAFHRIARFSLPYEVDSNRCVPDANGGLFAGTRPNSVSGYKFGGGVGTFVFENQLIVKDSNRYLVWNDYWQRNIGGKADFVVGQMGDNERLANHLGSRGLHTIDDKNRLWTVDAQGKAMIYQLPLRPDSQPLTRYMKLYWLDDGGEVDYRGYEDGIAFDPINKTIWVTDNKNHRLLRISNYDNWQERLLVDMVIGQPDKEHIKCNNDQEYGGKIWLAPGSPKANSLCSPYQIEFDRLGNLYVVENGYECHGNNRITVFTAEDLRTAAGLFPNIEAKKVFVSNNLTQRATCQPHFLSRWRENEPESPVSIAFNSKNQMVIGNDGYYPYFRIEQRAWRQLWFYEDPLKRAADGSFVQGQKPDAYINLPMGAAGEINFDDDDNLIIQDHTWPRVWVINLDRDPNWVVPVSR